jgi:hypothetical protein
VLGDFDLWLVKGSPAWCNTNAIWYLSD